MASTIQVRVDDELKSKSDQLFKDLGTDTTTTKLNKQLYSFACDILYTSN